MSSCFTAALDTTVLGSDSSKMLKQNVYVQLTTVFIADGLEKHSIIIFCSQLNHPTQQCGTLKDIISKL